MSKHSYTEIEFKNAPDHKTTPLNASNLNHIEGGISDAFTDIRAVEDALAPINLNNGTNDTGSTIKAGTYFYVSGAIARAMTDIANGATLTVNTNYQIVSEGVLNATPYFRPLAISGSAPRSAVNVVNAILNTLGTINTNVSVIGSYVYQGVTSFVGTVRANKSYGSFVMTDESGNNKAVFLNNGVITTSEDSVQVTANGVKKRSVLLSELYALVDRNRLKNTSTFKIVEGSTQYIYNLSLLTNNSIRFGHATIDSDGASILTRSALLGSTSHSGRYGVTISTNAVSSVSEDNNVPTNGTAFIVAY